MKIDIKSENGCSVALLSGEIDHHNAAEIRTKLDKYIISAQPKELVIDFKNITPPACLLKADRVFIILYC